MRGLAILLALAAAPAQAAGWRNADLGVRIDALPVAWEVRRADDTGFELRKRAVFGDYRYEEWLTLGVARDATERVESVAGSLRQQGFYVVDKSRLALDETETPFWFMFRQPAAEETEWLAIVMRGGVVFTLALRSTPNDLEALAEFGQVLQSFRFEPDRRDRAWRALLGTDFAAAEAGFDGLLRDDATDSNARYGRGLARLGRGDTADAKRDLERARDELGLSEDLRRALARVALDQGDAGKAALLWVRMLRDAPDWEAELRPWVVRAAERLEARGRARSETTAELATALVAMGTQLETVAQRYAVGELVVDHATIEAMRLTLREGINRAMDGYERSRVRADDVGAMLAALGLEQAANKIARGIVTSNEGLVAAGHAQLTRALRELGGSDGE